MAKTSTVLAVRYRPRRFADIVGNELHTNILKNSLTRKMLRTAYFFAGGKGSGKTSTARIFAKALNCTGRQETDPEPCNTCQSCLEVDRDVLMGDVLEIDAASQNSVSSIRNLISQVQYAPVSGKHKVVILDEVHMLSNAAANALLKTLEEPPDHVVFIFCTTDPQKVLDTVRSRALYFEFQRLSVEDISARLLFIANNEGISLQPEAAELVAGAVNGALRDAITIVDQASILANDGVVTTDIVAQIIGHVPTAALVALFTQVHADDEAKALAWLDAMKDKLEQDIVTSCLSFIETMILLNIGADTARRIPPDIAEETKKLAQVFNMRQLYNFGEVAKQTLTDHRRLSLRDSRVLLRLMVAGFVLSKEDKHADVKTQRKSLFELAQSGRTINFDVGAALRKALQAEPIDPTSPPEGHS